jgi:hypothetical protein
LLIIGNGDGRLGRVWLICQPNKTPHSDSLFLAEERVSQRNQREVIYAVYFGQVPELPI